MSRALLHQALDALESWHLSPPYKKNVIQAKSNAAIEALRAELAKPAQPAQEPLTDDDLNAVFRKSFSLIDSRMTPEQLAFARAIIKAAHGIGGKA